MEGEHQVYALYWRKILCLTTFPTPVSHNAGSPSYVSADDIWLARGSRYEIPFRRPPFLHQASTVNVQGYWLFD